MRQVVSIDFDIIMAPSITLYNDKVPALTWDELQKNPHFQLLNADMIHYQKILNYLLRCIQFLPKEKIHFIDDHSYVCQFIHDKVDLINIDHHHDIGYTDDINQKVTIPNCADWVHYLMDNNMINSYTWINNSNSYIEEKCVDYFPIKTISFQTVDIWRDLPIPDELILCMSTPWTPPDYRYLFCALIDICNWHYKTRFDIIYGEYKLDKE